MSLPQGCSFVKVRILASLERFGLWLHNRYVRAKAPEALVYLQQLLDVVPFELVQPTKLQVSHAASYTALKDALLVAAAKRARVDYLVSLDRRHLVGVPAVAKGSGLKIVLPEELLEEIRRQAGHD